MFNLQTKYILIIKKNYFKSPISISILFWALLKTPIKDQFIVSTQKWTGLEPQKPSG